MKLLTFRPKGRDDLRLGLVQHEAVMDLTQRSGGELADWVDVLGSAHMRRVEDAAAAFQADHAVADITFAPVVPSARKVLLVLLNYERDRVAQKRPKPVQPTLMPRFTDSIVGHGEALVTPKVTREFGFEGELAVVIGRGGRYIPRERAFEHVAGYTCFNDCGARDFIAHSRTFSAGRNFPGSAAAGPWIVTPDEFVYPSPARLEVRLNDEVFQSAATDDLTFPVDELIAYVSTFTALGPGDIIATGSPGGAGHTRMPPRFLRAGDVVDVAIEGIGVLSNPVVAEV